MPASIGVNLRVTGHCRQGGRKYMEDFFSVAYQQTEDERDLEYAFFGIYDGHGGAEAAAYAKEHLMELIVRQKNFWSDNDEDVLKAIKDGYIATHYAMWKEQAKWPKTTSGLPSTAGTTASIAFIRRGKIYIGHVGDSGIVLGYQESDSSSDWLARSLTKEHKPESAGEIQRIEQCGGKVVSKSGVPRVVWNRPRLGHQGPIRRSTPIDEIPFLAVARSLGDLWSYNSQLDEFVVSPDPDCVVVPIDTNRFRCLIFGTDGLYNMLSPQMAVNIVHQAEKHNENAALSDDVNKVWVNPSKCLVEKALDRWSSTKMRADNTSVITLLLDPPGPPRAQVLQNRKRKAYPDSGLEIVTRYEGESPPKRPCSDKNVQVDLQERIKESLFGASNLLRKMSEDYVRKGPTTTTAAPQPSSNEVGTSTDHTDEGLVSPKTGEAPSCNPQQQQGSDESSVQIHEISSSSNDGDEDRPAPQAKAKIQRLTRRNAANVDRPILRSRNLPRGRALGKDEVRPSLDRQLRVRRKSDGAKEERPSDPKGSGKRPRPGTSAKGETTVEWISTEMYRNLIRHKNSLQQSKSISVKIGPSGGTKGHNENVEVDPVVPKGVPAKPKNGPVKAQHRPTRPSQRQTHIMRRNTRLSQQNVQRLRLRR